MVVDDVESGGRASAFAYRDFRLLWSGQVLSSVGNWLLVLAVPYYVFSLTGSALATGAAFVVEVLPALLFGPIAGVFVDRWERHRVMVVVDVVRALCVLSLVLVQDRDLLWLLYVAVFLENTAGQFYRPARQAMLPAIVGRGRGLVSANSMNSLGEGVVRFVGGPLGGVLYAFLGFTGVVVVDAATYVVSATVIAALRVRSRGGGGTERSVRAVSTELRQGLRHLWAQPTVRGLLGISSVYLLANGAVTALLVPFVTVRLSGDARIFGLLLSALGVGYLVGAPISSRLADRLTPRTSVVTSVAAVAVCFFGLFNTTNLLVAFLFIALAGVPGVLLLVTIQTQVQRLIPDAVLGRVSAAFNTVEMAATVVGAAAAGLVAERWELVSTLNAAIAIMVFAAIGGVLLLPRDREQHSDVTGDIA